MGSDLGAAVKGFRQGMETEKPADSDQPESHQLGAEASPSPSASQPAKKESAPN
jgi:Sec-independent protein translocase protein TatA